LNGLNAVVAFGPFMTPTRRGGGLDAAMIGKLIEEVLCSRVLEQVCLRSTPVDGAALLDSIKRVFRRYIVLPKSADVALSLWVLHAWTMDAGDISPFMVLVSPTKRCGKTSVLVLLFYLTPKSELASNITAARSFAISRRSGRPSSSTKPIAS
jgi:hypothetical protein